MTREVALSLLSGYAPFCANEALDFKPESDRDILESAAGMSERFPFDGSEAKAMRWLGYMQGICVAYGIYSLEQVKQHSMRGKL